MLDVEAEINRPLGLGHGDSVAPHDAVRDGPEAARLVVPLDEVAHQISLNERGMDPVDPRPPLA